MVPLLSHNVTRLTYNCAHLRSTKEGLTFEYDIWWYWGSNGWYLVVLGQYGAELVYTGWYWDSIGRYRAFMPVYIEKYGDLVGCYLNGTTNKRTRKDRATQPMDHGRLRWATKNPTGHNLWPRWYAFRKSIVMGVCEAFEQCYRSSLKWWHTHILQFHL